MNVFKNRNNLKTLALAILICAIVLILILPTQLDIFILLAAYVLLMIVGFNLYQLNKQVMSKVKTLDGEGKFNEVIETLDFAKTIGYDGFVMDSYRIYANYMLGDFLSYRKVAFHMAKTRQWRRPKFSNIRKKIETNLSLIDLIESYGQNHPFFSGQDVLFIQAVEAYKQNNKDEILQMINAYPKLSPLKQFCLWMLLDNEKEMRKIFPNGEVWKILNREG